MKRYFLSLIGLSLVSPLAAQAEGSPRTMIVMDGSGSMWGQIDGRAKLEIARETVSEVLGTVPAEQEIGLIAYGHRRKGDCGDIELVVPPASGASGRIAQEVNTMRFLGKTPLSAAVRQAAEVLRYGEEAATVVLVTDGLETCEADPCALGRELEAGGLDFTAHVIGFGLTREEGAQVACLAQETGGRYIEARDAAGLASALTQTVHAQPVSPPQTSPKAGLTAPETAPIGSLISVGWSVSEISPYDTITIGLPADPSAENYVYASQGNPLDIQAPGAVGSYELRYVSADHTVVARKPIEITPAPLKLTAVDAAQAGQLVPVFWQGPDAEYDNIQVREVGGESYSAYEYVSGKNPLVLKMPEEPGKYELVYMLNDREPLITRPITVVPLGQPVPEIASSLSAPASVAANTDFPVGWSGPAAASDSIWLRKVGDSGWESYAYLADGNPLTLRSPSEPGPYEIVYKLGDAQDLAVRQLQVVDPLAAVPVTIMADDGGLFSVIWSGVPAPENTAGAEAWAMQEGIHGPVEAAFVPGEYDILGEAGDQTFAGRIVVSLEGENQFTIPLDPARSSAGPDQPAATPSAGDPVEIKIQGEYPKLSTRWEAIPVSGQMSDRLGQAYQPDGWQTALDPGRWLITGYAEGATAPLYAAAITVEAGRTPPSLTLPRTAAPSASPENLPSGDLAAAQCSGEVACYFSEAELGVKGVLMPNWAVGNGLFYETAAGVKATDPSLEFYGGSPLELLAALNPRQWDLQLGPCETVALGALCALHEADPAAIALLAASLEKASPRVSETAAGVAPKQLPAAAASPAAPSAPQALEADIPLPLPEGFNATEFFAPQLLEK